MTQTITRCRTQPETSHDADSGRSGFAAVRACQTVARHPSWTPRTRPGAPARLRAGLPPRRRGGAPPDEECVERAQAGTDEHITRPQSVGLCGSLRLLLLLSLLLLFVLRRVLFLALLLVLLALVSHEAPPASIVPQRSRPRQRIAGVSGKQTKRSAHVLTTLTRCIVDSDDLPYILMFDFVAQLTRAKIGPATPLGGPERSPVARPGKVGCPVQEAVRRTGGRA
jgi:hypothetical protein